MVYSVVCERIKELRKARGMTQVELAKRLSVSKSVVSSYENAVHHPPYDILVKLASIFKVSCDYLLGVEKEPSISTEGLTPTQINAIVTIVSEFREGNSRIE